MVVRVVVRERTECAGEEKVLSPPRRDSMPPFAVRLVPASDEAPREGAVMDREVSFSVDIVGATDLPPAVGGVSPSVSIDERKELSRAREVALVLVLLAVDME